MPSLQAVNQREIATKQDHTKGKKKKMSFHFYRFEKKNQLNIIID